MAALRRASSLVLSLLLASALLVPTMPGDWLGGVPRAYVNALRKVSVSQRWSMYAPNPQRSLAFMTLDAEYPDDRVERMYDGEDPRLWRTTGFWAKSRMAVWQYYALLKSKKRNRNRTWFLRAQCIEALRRYGELPLRVRMTAARRRFTPPAKVARGAEVLRPLKLREVQVEPCRTKVVRAMLRSATEGAGGQGTRP